MDWNIMEPGGSGGAGLGCFIQEVYVPSDDCEEVLDELIETLMREDPKLRNGRRKLFFDKIVEKDLVPLIMCCTDEDIIARTLRLLANLTQPLEVFLQLGVPLGQQCQREINGLVTAAKARCTDIDFFKSLHRCMEMALLRGGETVVTSDSELLNHALLLLRNLFHTGSEDSELSESSITLQSMVSSFFLSGMDQLVLRMLGHIQKTEWVVSIVQLLSLVFKNYAGELLDGDAEDKSDCESDIDNVSLSDVYEFVPSQTSKLLSHSFNKQLQIGNLCTAAGADDSVDKPQNEMDQSEQRDNGDALPNESAEAVVGGAERRMQTDEESEGCDTASDKFEDCYENVCASSGVGENMSQSEGGGQWNKGDNTSLTKKSGGIIGDSMGEERERTAGDTFHHNGTCPSSTDDADSGRPDSREEEEREKGAEGGEGEDEEEREEGGDQDSGVEEYSDMVWEDLQMVRDKEREIMSELSGGSCLMDNDIILAYLRKFATEIVCSGLSNLVQCLMKALMSSYEGVLDDSFFMWTVGFFLSFARHASIEFSQYRDLLNLDVIGFLVYQGYRNCETLAYKQSKKENCSIIRHRLHLVVCTLNQLFQLVLIYSKQTEDKEDYIVTLQKCLAQMGDLQRLFILLIHWHQSAWQDQVYLRDLVHTNHIYLLLLEEWVSLGFVPPRFSMLAHVKQYASVTIMQKYGSVLDQYSDNSEALNVAVLTMMYHIAGDCNRADVLLQLPILKKFSEIWGDVTCNEHVEFNDLIEFILESFMSMACKDPIDCAQKLFEATVPDIGDSAPNTINKVGGEAAKLSEEDQDLLFTWITELEGETGVVDELVRRLHSRGSTATRQQVMLHLLQNGWLEEKQMEALSEEIRKLQEMDTPNQKTQLATELSTLEQDQLLPFLVDKVKGAGLSSHLQWLQDQLLEAAYVRLGVRDNKYRVHVEEPLARFYALQDKSIPLVMINESEERAVKSPYFTALLQALGLFPADTESSCVFCRIPHFLTPAQLVKKAQQLGEVDLGMMKFDLTELQDELSFTELSPLFKDEQSKEEKSVDFSSPPARQDHNWLNYIRHLNQSKEAVPAV